MKIEANLVGFLAFYIATNVFARYIILRVKSVPSNKNKYYCKCML